MLFCLTDFTMIELWELSAVLAFLAWSTTANLHLEIVGILKWQNADLLGTLDTDYKLHNHKRSWYNISANQARNAKDANLLNMFVRCRSVAVSSRTCKHVQVSRHVDIRSDKNRRIGTWLAWHISYNSSRTITYHQINSMMAVTKAVPLFHSKLPLYLIHFWP